MQLLTPLQTPQLSSPSSQHRPDGSTALKQHLPNTSMATPLPPHTPHASTDAAVQHRPAQSTLLLTGQLIPVVESMKPTLHVPLMSTTPSLHGGAEDGGSSNGTSHAPPPQQPLHTQRWLVVLHAQRVDGQSASTVQAHVDATVHGADSKGFASPVAVPSEARQAPSAKILPAALLHTTARDCTPGPPSHGRLGVTTGTQGPHGSIDHDVWASGQGKRLHGRDVRKPSGAWP